MAINGYELTRKWFDFAFETKECKAAHTAIYLWAVELNNRLGWKKEFGLPTHSTMEGLSIGNKLTYLTALSDIERWGFIKVVKESKNQFSSTIIQICYSEIVTPLVSALQQHCNSIDNGIGVGIAPIDKPTNKKPKTIKQFEIPSIEELTDYVLEKGYPKGLASKIFEYYNVMDWIDSKGDKVKNWKIKCLSVWFNEENRVKYSKAEPKKEGDIVHWDGFKCRINENGKYVDIETGIIKR